MIRWYVIKTDLAGRRDAKYLINDHAPWRHLPPSYGGMAAAADRLNDVWFDVLIPMERELKLVGKPRKPKAVDRPQFPGYLLAAFDITVPGIVSALLKERGVWSILGMNDRPVPVRQSVVDELIAKDIARAQVTVDDMLDRQRQARRAAFTAGACVQLTGGHFAGQSGVVRDDDGGRNIRLTVMGMLEVTAPAEHVVAA